MFDAIDWTRPWYDSVRPAFARLDMARSTVDALNAAGGAPVTFVPQSALPAGQAYEQFIGATDCVPTRENLHDFFNGLVWLTFPKIKRQLNILQSAQIARDGVSKSRGPARDGATIFDENCALLVVRGELALVDHLRAHAWREALFEQRAQFGRNAQVWLFGHALMEKLVAPRKAITAHTRVVVADDAYFARTWDEQRAWIDEHVAGELANTEMNTACFTPLPVLGVPGWWDGQDEFFYADATVFRPKRIHRSEA
ncbi:MAG: DUF3025 domain-containing protein [Pseudomonadota bacterium]